MARKLVVIAYAAADEAEGGWYGFVRGHLQAALGGAEVDILVDEGGGGAAEWSAGVAQALQICDAFLMLVSPQALSLSFLPQRIEALAERELQGEPPLTVAILLTPASEAALGLIGRAARFPGDGKTLSDFAPPERDELMRRLAEAAAHEILKAEPQAPVVETEAAFREWLPAQPPRVAVALAARSALRALPHSKPHSFRKVSQTDAALRAFAAAAFAWTAARRPELAGEDRAVALAEAASSVDASASASAAYAAAYAASPDPSVYSADAAVYAADAAAHFAETAGRATAASAWRAAFADADLAARLPPDALPQAPLWPEGAPDWAREAWAGMRARLPEEGRVWVDWYEARLAGAAAGEADDLAFAEADASSCAATETAGVAERR